MRDPDELAVAAIWGQTLRRVPSSEVSPTIVEEGPNATEWVQVLSRILPLYVITVGARRGYLAIGQLPSDEQVFLAACELFGNIGAAVPEVHRVRRDRGGRMAAAGGHRSGSGKA
jgi:hypothetical protein